MLLMNKNTPLLEFSESGIIDINYAADFLFPYALQNYVYAKPVILMRALNKWVKERTIPTTRANYDALIRSLNLQPHSRFNIARLTKCLSLNDTYWIKLNNHQTWESVNLYENSFQEAISDIALTGTSKPFTITGEIMTPETTTDGQFAKCWSRESDGIYLYKSSNNLQNIYAEYLSCCIAEILKLDYVPYTLAMRSGKLCTKCRCICSPDYAILTAKEYMDHIGLRDFETSLPEDYWTPIYEMLLFDYLIGNKDRHLRNWGFTVDTHSNNLIGLHPLFDHNLAMLPSLPDEQLISPSFNNRPLLDLAIEAITNIHHQIDNLYELESYYYLSETIDQFTDVFYSIDTLNYLRQNLETLIEYCEDADLRFR